MTSHEQQNVFDSWVSQHAAVLHHVANGFATGADRHDLMQELLLAVWRAVPRFRGDAGASTFVYRVAHNTALTWKRTERNYRQRVDRFEALAIPEEHAAAEASSRQRETLDHLYAHIRQLPPLDRSLILLQLDGLSYAEISAIHGLSETNVGARLNRLKQKLAQAMKEILHELR